MREFLLAQPISTNWTIERTFFGTGILDYSKQVPEAQLQINIVRNGEIKLNEDESYQLKVEPNKIAINATTDLGFAWFGNAFTTVAEQQYSFIFLLRSFQIPRFTWRIDRCRKTFCYQKKSRCYGINENECFHWHLADDQGWRIEMKNHLN
jgi:hexosaminidase